MRRNQGSVKTWVLFFLIILLFFFGLLWLQRAQEKPAEEVIVPPTQVERPEEVPIEELSEDQKRAADKKSLIAATRGDGDCEAIEHDEALRQTCFDNHYYDLGLKRNDENQCKEIKNDELRETCLNKVLFAIASQSYDIDLCQQISNAELKQSCIDRVQAFLGRTAKTGAACDRIQDEALKLECLDNFYYSNSIDELNASGCQNIKSENLKERCNKIVSKNLEVIEVAKNQKHEFKTPQQTLQNCSNQNEAFVEQCEDGANMQLAATKRDLSYCNNISDTDLEQKCIQKTTIAIAKYSLSVAMAKKDPSYCNQIPDSETRTTCITLAQQ